MWIITVPLVIIGAAALTLAAARRNREESKFLPWDIPRVSATYTTIVGSLSGFAVASSIFVANLRVNLESAQFEQVIGLFLAGFIIFIGTAMMFGTVPNSPDLEREPNQHGSTQFITYALASINFYLGLSAIWFALRPLLLALDLPLVASIFTWILLFVAIAGATSLGIIIFHMTRFGNRVIILIPIVGFGIATLYRQVLAQNFPILWPSENSQLAFMVLQFVVAGIGFSTSNLLLWRVPSKVTGWRTRHRRENFLLALAQSAACSVALLWWAVTAP